MKIFTKIVKVLKPWKNFAKSSMSDVSRGAEYVSDLKHSVEEYRA